MLISFISPFPPRHDGVSEFNQDLIKSLLVYDKDLKYLGIAINESNNYLKNYYPEEVKFQIRKDILSDYKDASDFINKTDADLVVLQLEYALYGGFDGKYIEFLISRLTKKLVIIVHGLPINSYSRRKETRKKLFKNICPYVSGFITINPLQKRILEEWGLKNKIINILHGAPDEIESYNKDKEKKKLGLSNSILIFNFGLIHKRKGLEYLLEAYKNFSHRYENTSLVLAGETLINEKDNSYIKSLIDFVNTKNLGDKVKIINRFIDRKELFTYLSASDVIVLPYIKRDLVSSGPLSFAILAKKFIITTPYSYAKILLTKKDAFFIPFKSSQGIEKGLEFFIHNKNNKVKNYVKNISFIAGKIKWSKIGLEYYNFFKDILKD